MTRLARVVGESMAPTYRPSDLLLTRPAGRVGAPAARGDAVVFRHGGHRMIKRVVGLPGDLVALEAGRLSINGVALAGGRAVRGAFTQSWSVPAFSYFMAGDDPETSDDSRVWENPFVAFGSVEAVVVRRLPWNRRARTLRLRRTGAAAAQAA